MYGASPDSLCQEDGLLEVKTTKPHLYVIDMIESPYYPPDRFKWQMIGQCLVTGRDWCDLIQYCEPFHTFRVLRLEPTDTELEYLEGEILAFCAELDQLEAETQGEDGRVVYQGLS